MKIRLPFAALLLGAAFVSAPAMAQDAAADEAEATAADAKPDVRRNLSPVVDADPANDPENVLVLDLSNGGRVLIRLNPEWAPRHVERIKKLAREGFYDGVIFHRVIDGFMAQTGDPSGTGQGGSELPDLQSEFNALPHLRGTVSMARTNDPDSANSQFFIVFYPRFALDRKYTVFGRVISGMQYVDEIHRGEPPQDPTRIVQASLGSQNKSEPAPAASAEPADVSISVDDLSNSVSD